MITAGAVVISLFLDDAVLWEAARCEVVCAQHGLSLPRLRRCTHRVPRHRGALGRATWVGVVTLRYVPEPFRRTAECGQLQVGPTRLVAFLKVQVQVYIEVHAPYR